jgi:hypothetical protein
MNNDNSSNVTGREALLAIFRACGVQESLTIKIVESLAASGYVCVPQQPTRDMLDAAWADALEEDAAGVWGTMIGVSSGALTREGIPVT